MKRLKTLTMTAVALVMLFAGPSTAQTVPTLSAVVGAPTAFGALVTLHWSALPLAQGYTLEAGVQPGVPLLTYSVPASVTQVDLLAPNGTYYVRIRGFAGAIVGEFSAEQVVVVGGPVTCPPLVAPTVAAASAAGLSVKVDWTPVAGATGYTVEYSRFDGITELAEASGPAVNSVIKVAGISGNFFVRVVAHNACHEVAASPYVPFEIVWVPGPRTPDPAPGTIIPRASLAYAEGVILQVASQFPGDLHNSCFEHGGTNTFLFRVIQRLRLIDSRWGLNHKYGRSNDLSQDIIAYNPTDRPDNGEQQIYLYDIIAGHCGGRPDAWMQDVTDVTWTAGAAGGCNNRYCARWDLQPYLRAGFPPDGRQ